jgi:hypothetical protein
LVSHIKPFENRKYSADNDFLHEKQDTIDSKKKKISKGRMCISLFTCRRQTDRPENKNYEYKMVMDNKVKILSTSETHFSGSSKKVELKVSNYLGMVDTTIYRRIYVDWKEDSNAKISKSIETAIV